MSHFFNGRFVVGYAEETERIPSSDVSSYAQKEADIQIVMGM